ncbi:DeoR/GlpR family DNA-binding transcription regulator [Enterobacter cancerogenus]|uniref:DeoR/GlpR family DNA-binding transcription regulator n=1 Tax=Enterobacter cancerogenus TaxID=69218 RepID=UPI000538C783|nr:DeoR/GlpR family DNA-binding transcription regulator [Enterobacter cancerogenus]KGT88710.1 hypothetical protein NH00_19065 [Enterobacter cancerogenus]
MLPSQRQAKIIEMLHGNEVISFNSLANLLGVSTMTIRRDVIALTILGHAEAVYGGVKSLEVRLDTVKDSIDNSYQKAAQLAVGEIIDKSFKKTIFLDSGMFGKEIAKILAAHQDLTFITRDIDVAFYLHRNSNSTLIFLGGNVNKSGATDDHFTIEQLTHLNIEHAFLHVRSIDEFGISVDDINTANFYKKVVSQSKNVVLLSNKLDLDCRELYRSFELDNCQMIIIEGEAKNIDLLKISNAHPCIKIINTARD